VLEGARLVETPWVACCEDDTLYSPQHFDSIPSDSETFFYNAARWWLEPAGLFRYRRRHSLCACIVSRDLLIQTLEARFAKYPECPPGRWAWSNFGEPGRVEDRLGLPRISCALFETFPPGVVTLNHRDSLGGQRRMGSDPVQDTLIGWGKAADLWRRIHG
jgi:hypothetical protein